MARVGPNGKRENKKSLETRQAGYLGKHQAGVNGIRGSGTQCTKKKRLKSSRARGKSGGESETEETVEKPTCKSEKIWSQKRKRKKKNWKRRLKQREIKYENSFFFLQRLGSTRLRSVGKVKSYIFVWPANANAKCERAYVVELWCTCLSYDTIFPIHSFEYNGISE